MSVPLTAANESFFLDTNVVVYSFDDAHLRKQRSALALMENALQFKLGIVSTQVIQEFFNLALNKFSKNISSADALRFSNRFLWPLCKVYPSADLYGVALSIHTETEWTFYDSLIVAAAAQAGCKTLLTEDLQAGRKIRGVEIRNPFA